MLRSYTDPANDTGDDDEPHDLFDSDALFDRAALHGAADWTARRATWTVSQIAAELTESRGRAGGRPVGKSTVRRWCQEGLLRADTTRGGHYRVAAENLREFLGMHPDELPDANDAAEAA